MTISVNEGQGNANSATSAPSSMAPAMQEQFSQRQQTRMNNPTSIFELASAGREFIPMSATSEAEALQLLMTTAKELLEKSASKNFEIQMLPVSGPTHGLFCSALVLTANLAGKQSGGVAYHTLLLADSNPNPNQPSPVQISIPGVPQQVEVLRVVGDAYNDKYRDVVSGVVTRAFPNVPPAKLFQAEAEVVPRGFDYKNVEAVRRLMSNALRATGVVLGQALGYENEFRLPKDSSGLTSIVRQLVQQPQTPNYNGMPVRTDVILEFNEARGQRKTMSPGEIPDLNGDNQEKTLFRLAGFVDIAWNPEVGAVQTNQFLPQYQQQQQQSKHLYSPRFVVTMMEPGELNNLPGQLLGLATVAALGQDANWAMSFKRPVGEEVDIRDLGAIGIEANIENNPTGFGLPIDTRSNTFTDQSLAMLIQAFIRPELVVAMDVEEVGPTTWMNSIFLAAARGNNKATQMILGAADYLTNGHFQKFYEAGQPVAVLEQNRIHNGWYLDRNGVRRDIRDVDHLAVLNVLGRNDPQMARDFSDTFNRVNFSLEQRLFARKRIIEATIGSEVHYTDFSERVIFNPKFINSLAQGVLATGLIIRPQTPYQDANSQTRAAATFLNNFGLSTKGVGLFQAGYTNVNSGGYRNNSQSFGRWSI